MSKIALITGATRGIGKEIALTLAQEGYNIAINYRTENDELKTTKKEIENLNVECLAVKGDISKYRKHSKTSYRKIRKNRCFSK